MKNNNLPNSLVYFGTCAGVLQILRHKRLPLFRIPSLKDPFLPSPSQPISFSKQELYEESVKFMSAAILGKEMPRGNPNHPLQKAIARWRGEERFSSESEIRESLENLLPPMVEQTYAEANSIHRQWQDFIKHKAMLPLFVNYDDPMMWYNEGRKYAGVAIRFKVAEDSPFEQCSAVSYSQQPISTVSLRDTRDLLVGMAQELIKDFDSTMIRQSSVFRSQKEWRLILEKEKPEELYFEYSINLVQSLYIGPLVDEDKVQQLKEYTQLVNKNINIYQAKCSDIKYELDFVKLE